MDIATAEQPTRQALAIEGRSGRLKVTGKLKLAMDAMVWDGLTRDQAATKAGLSIHGLREALKRPHVRQYYKDQIEVLRDNERARNIHRLMQIRDAADNMPAVQAIKMLEQLGDDAAPAQKQILPGLVVQLNIAQPAHQPLHVDARPLAALPGTVQDADNAQE